ncbi:hypothetical protein ACIPT2_09850 [Pectobacterium brasiliense]|uniref:hypothetical protein n=1 Tax=Pectobacterium brasiliense TaxID=180957 RepID=UPI0037F158FC
MNIDLWLEKTLSNIRSSDPKALIAKMEQYGLIEDDVNRDHRIWSDVELASVSEINTGDTYLNNYVSSGYSISIDFFGQRFIHSEELTFTATPRNAAFTLDSSSLNDNNPVNSNSQNAVEFGDYATIFNHFSGYDSSNSIIQAA